MISIKIASVMAVAAFAAGSIFASPVQQAIAAVIATDVQCTGCVGTADIAGSAVTSAKVKDNSITAADLATDSVGSSEIIPNSVGAVELQGVTKLQYTACSTDSSFTYGPGAGELNNGGCKISGLTSSDRVIVAKENGNACFVLTAAVADSGFVNLYLYNVCNTNQVPGTITYSIIVYRAG